MKGKGGEGVGKGEMVDGCSCTTIMLMGFGCRQKRERLVLTAEGQKKNDVVMMNQKLDKHDIRILFFSCHNIYRNIVKSSIIPIHGDVV